MKIIVRKKLYRGLFEIREYERTKLLNNGKNATLRLQGEIESQEMVITIAQLRNAEVINTVTGPRTGDIYRMYGIPWKGKPIYQRQEAQIDNNVMLKLRDRFNQSSK